MRIYSILAQLIVGFVASQLLVARQVDADDGRGLRSGAEDFPGRADLSCL
jgi:hypothetical protein